MRRSVATQLRFIFVTALAVSGLVVLGQSSATATTGAVSTTTNVGASTGACLNGSPSPDVVNCNHYTDKPDVWLSGLPVAAALGDGYYFFAVIAPGGQPDPNDGAQKLLSTDTRADRSFSMSGNTISNLGTHALVDNKLQLVPYADTPNNGGVYIMAVCQMASATDIAPVDPSDCKYDAFKVDGITPGPGPENPLPPTVTKDASGSYNQPYSWTIDKSVDKTVVHQVGGNATFNYTVALDRTAGAPTGVTVAGTITVNNPNDDLVTADVTDVLSDTTTCTVTGGAGALLAPGDNEFAYTCPLTSLPSSIDNTATVTWATQDVGDVELTGDHADYTVTGVAFSSSPIDECVDVTDTFGLHGTTGTTAAPGSGDNPNGTYCADTTLHYSRTIAVPAHDCLVYDNTAAFVTTDDANDTDAHGSDSESVTVCGPLATGARTIGFWQNKNGQDIIKGGASTAGVCNSGTYLRTFNPFKDVSATATCTQVATYVTNVVKAANASGASMNAMLKAQMLATALDVYFTGTGSTASTRVYLPNSNLGGVTIDLTMICSRIGSCAGSYIDVSSAFGGASSLTVSQMLAYASGQSNSGGLVWYAQVKSTQEKAKDAFDAINNEVAFGP